MKLQKTILGFVIIAFCAAMPSSFAAETLSDVPKGMQELTEFKAPVALFVPEDFQKSKARSLLIVVPGSVVYSKEILNWQDLAKTKNLVVACPSLVVRDEDVPYKVDEWMLKLKNALAIRYNVDRSYIIGLGASANYVSYLGLKHAQEFDAVSSVGGSWTGPYEKLTQISGNAEDQTPFYIALEENDERVAATQAKAEEMKSKGYKVQLVMLNVKGEENTDAFRSGIIRWFDEQAAKNELVRSTIKSKKKTFKQKFSAAVDDFFRV